MSDDLRLCSSGCCYFVHNPPTIRSAYELAARASVSSRDLPWQMETLIPCRKTAGKVQYAIESILGFYLGLRVPRTTKMPIVGSTSQLVFERVTGDFLRVATHSDLQRWNATRRQVLRNVNAARDQAPGLLQIPFGHPKS